jgi:hypothetical protein
VSLLHAIILLLSGLVMLGAVTVLVLVVAAVRERGQARRLTEALVRSQVESPVERPAARYSEWERLVKGDTPQ